MSFLLKILIILIITLITSCSDRVPDNIYLYDQVGFDSQELPQNSAPARVNTTKPIYYQPNYYYVPASSLYSNPYAFAPPINQNKGGDIDQYYSSPNRFKNIERYQ